MRPSRDRVDRVVALVCGLPVVAHLLGLITLPLWVVAVLVVAVFATDAVQELREDAGADLGAMLWTLRPVTEMAGAVVLAAQLLGALRLPWWSVLVVLVATYVLTKADRWRHRDPWRWSVLSA